jgi:hypothetical protein
MAGYMDVDKAIETAKKLVGEKRAVLAQIDTVRSDLRHAVTRKETSSEQTKWIEETFPIRERTRKPKAATTAAAAA